MPDNIETRVALLEKELSQVTGLFDRLDTTIEKLTDVSNSIKQLLAVHETKINQQEITVRDIYSEMEKRRIESSSQHAALQQKITKDMEEIEKRICSKILELSSKTSSLDKWRWIVIGGAIVAGVILDFVLKSIGLQIQVK